jgi:SAM-dependent methyltransferase
MARDELFQFLQKHAANGRPVDVASVPCGIPRDLLAAAERYRAQGGNLANVRFHALDLDPQVLDDAAEFAKKSSVTLIPQQGDALDIGTYTNRFDFITSTGLGEFLDDEKLARLYAVFYEVLRPGGVMVTSGMRRTRIAGYLLELAELRVHYRSTDELMVVARAAGFKNLQTSTDRSGIQGFLRAIK